MNQTVDVSSLLIDLQKSIILELLIIGRLRFENHFHGFVIVVKLLLNAIQIKIIPDIILINLTKKLMILKITKPLYPSPIRITTAHTVQQSQLYLPFQIGYNKLERFKQIYLMKILLFFGFLISVAFNMRFRKHLTLISPMPPIQEIYSQLIANQTKGTHMFNSASGIISVDVTDSAAIDNLVSKYKINVSGIYILKGLSEPRKKIERFCLSTIYHCRSDDQNNQYLIQNSKQIYQQRFLNIDQIAVNCQQRCTHFLAQNVTINQTDQDNVGFSIFLLKVVQNQQLNGTIKQRLDKLCTNSKYVCDDDQKMQNKTISLKITHNLYKLDDVANILYKRGKNFRYVNDQLLTFKIDENREQTEFMLRSSGNLNFVDQLNSSKQIQLFCSYGYECFNNKTDAIMIESHQSNVVNYYQLAQVICVQNGLECDKNKDRIIVQQGNQQLYDAIIDKAKADPTQQDKKQQVCKIVQCQQDKIILKNGPLDLDQILQGCLETKAKCNFQSNKLPQNQSVRMNLPNNSKLVKNLYKKHQFEGEDLSNLQMLNKVCDLGYFCLIQYPDAVMKLPKGYQPSGSQQDKIGQYKVQQLAQICLQNNASCILKQNKLQVKQVKNSPAIQKIVQKIDPQADVESMSQDQKNQKICEVYTCVGVGQFILGAPPSHKLSYSKGELPSKNINNQQLSGIIDKCPYLQSDKKVLILYQQCLKQQVYDCAIFYDQNNNLNIQFPHNQGFQQKIYQIFLQKNQTKQDDSMENLCQNTDFECSEDEFGYHVVRSVAPGQDFQCEQLDQKYNTSVVQKVQNQTKAIYQKCIQEQIPNCTIGSNKQGYLQSTNISQDQDFFKNIYQDATGTDQKIRKTYHQSYCQIGMMKCNKEDNIIVMTPMTDKQLIRNILLLVKKTAQLGQAAQQTNLNYQIDKDGNVNVNQTDQNYKPFVNKLYKSLPPSQQQPDSSQDKLQTYLDQKDIQYSKGSFAPRGRSDKQFGMPLVKQTNQNQNNNNNKQQPEQKKGNMNWLLYLLSGLLGLLLLILLIYLCVKYCGKKQQKQKAIQHKFSIGFVQSRRQKK